MSHTVQINLTADQEIRLLGEDVNIYEIETIFVESDGRIVWFTRKASQPYVEADDHKCPLCKRVWNIGYGGDCECGAYITTA